MIRDKYSQCILCFADPCRCGKMLKDACNRCTILEDEVAALRREVKRYQAQAEEEKDRRFLLEKEMLTTRRVGRTGGRE